MNPKGLGKGRFRRVPRWGKKTPSFQTTLSRFSRMVTAGMKAMADDMIEALNRSMWAEHFTETTA